jgi:DNA-binding LacI/PurR family transcriptional regulator
LKAKPTFRQLARAAGVSNATVSRMLTGSAAVSPEVQERIRKTAGRLGIDLIQGDRLHTLAFILSNRDVLHLFHARVLMGAESYCAEHECDILFTLFSYSGRVPWNELHLPRLMRRRDVANALILAGTNSENLLLALRQQGIPFAVLGNNMVGAWQKESYDSVSSDDIQGGNEITKYLISLGHRHIWFIGNTRLPWFAAGYEGYLGAMREAGLSSHCSEIDSGDDEEIGYLGTKAILVRQETVTAIFAGSDHVAQGVYKASFDAGLRIPDDLSVVGCNDIYGQFLHPSLTSIREYPEQFGKRLAQLALERLRRPDAPPRQVTVPTAIAKRESCLPLRYHTQVLPSKDKTDENELAKAEIGSLA